MDVLSVLTGMFIMAVVIFMIIIALFVHEERKWKKLNDFGGLRVKDWSRPDERVEKTKR